MEEEGEQGEVKEDEEEGEERVCPQGDGPVSISL